MKYNLSLYAGLILCLLSLQLGLSQPKNNILKDVSMPAPNAASLGKYGDIPVSYFTGVPNIGIPIYTVQDGSLSLPISLSYHASGVKVGETASWVGLNWSLNAGGMITRTVMGIPDELLGRGYLTCASRLRAPLSPGDVIATLQADSIARGQLDSEPDMYTFNVGGHAGKFTFDENKKIHFIPKADFKVEYTTQSYSNGQREFTRFILTAPDGTRYIFGTDPLAPGSALEYQTYDESSPWNKAPSSWYLVAIESHDGINRIRLRYEVEAYSYFSLASWTNESGSWEAGGINIGPYKRANTNYIDGRRLAAIYSPTATIKFVPNTNIRTDLDGSVGAKSLAKIEIRNGLDTNTCYNTFEFFNSYFVTSGGSTTAYRRLRLDSLREKSCDGTIVNPAYKFDYHPGEIPNRYSYAIDHWGFANGQAGNDNTYNVSQVGLPPNPPVFVQANANRESVYAPMVVGTLQKITYPTKGSTTFTFEANRISGGYNNTTYQTVEATRYELTSCNIPPSAPACCNANVTDFETFTAQSLNLSGSNDIKNSIYMRLDLMNILNVNENPGSFKYCTPNGGPPHSNQIWTRVEIWRVSDNNMVFSQEFNIAVNSTSGSWPQYPVLASMLDLNVNYRIVLRTINGRASFRLYSLETVASGGGSSTNTDVGGLRIREIRNHDGIAESNDVIKRYNYTTSFESTQSSGILYNRPLYYGIGNFVGGETYDSAGVIKPRSYGNNPNLAYLLFFSTSITPLSGYHGYHIGYSFVWEEHVGGGGRTAYSFVLGTPTLYNLNQAPHPTPPLETQPLIGLETQHLMQNSAGTEVAKTQTEYKTVYYTFLPGKIFKIHRSYIPPPSGGSSWPAYKFSKLEYSIRTAPVLVARKTEIVDGVSTITDLQYDPYDRFLAPTAIVMTNSDNKVTTTTNVYVHDMPQVELLGIIKDELLNRNIIAQPLLTTTSVDGVQIGGSRLNYALYNSSTGLPNLSPSTVVGHHPYPYQFLNYEMTWDQNNTAQVTGWVLKGTINSYHGSGTNGRGNPKQVTIANWLPETYEWNNGLLTQKTYNQHTQTYSYVAGTRLVSSSTAIDGQIINYTYDKLQRLKTASARGGNLLSTYDYTYRSGGNLYNSVKSTTTLTAVSGSSLTSKATVQLLDGLGRPIEDIKIQHNPTKGQDGTTSSATDVVTHYQYDAQGRMYQQSLPFVSPNTNGTYYAPPVGTKYSTSTFEASPLSRTLTVTPPDWYATSSAYGTNAANEVLIPGTSNFYAAGTLRKTTITDPDNRVGVTYTDKKGRLILKRQTDTGNTNPALTYYQYDNKDRVIRVMPPSVASATTDLVFAYQYDGADRMTRKKVPDMGSISMRYNNRDKLVFVLDSMQMGLSRCLGTKYDDYGRPLESGFVSGFPTDPNVAFSFSEVLSRTWYDGFDGYAQLNLTTNPQYRGKVRRSETRLLDGANNWLYNVIDYDTHGRTTAINGNNHLNLGVSNAEAVSMTYDWADNALAETRTHTPGAAGATGAFSIQNTYTYDHVGRRTNFLTTIGGVGQHIAEYNYNHRDELVEKNLHANQVAGAWGWLQSIDYSYNTQGWLTGVNNWATSATVNTPALCTPAMPNPASPTRSYYNEANDLMYMDLRYDQPFTGISGLTAAPAQKAGNISQIASRVRGREAQIMSYSYDYLSRLSTSTFHNYSDAGVISGTNNYNENLTYDLRGNIQTLQRTGFYTNGSTCTYGQIDNLTYSYTANTNRLQKVLDGTVTAGDAKSRGFNGNLSTVDNSMTYDRNGNLNKNLHKNVSTITYNHLNLPTVITFTSGNTIEFLYDASGMKLRKTVKVGATVQYVQDYLPGGIEYRQTGTGVKRVESVFHAEGRYYNTNVEASNTLAWRKEYNFKDHLGNTRLVFTDRNANGLVDITGTASTSDVLQENHYYSFGLAFEGPWLQNDATARDNKYQYNGKELNDDFGLNWNDYGARWYDGSIGRWNGIDPLVGKFSSWSPYNYVMGNPIVNVDPDGRDVKVNKEGNHVSISYHGAIIDESNSLSRKDVRQIRREIKSNLKSSFTGSGDGISYSIKVKLRIASNSSDLKGNESSVVLADEARPELKKSYGQAPDGFQAYVSATDRSNSEIAKTATHEIGHTMGLPHNVQESKKTGSTIMFGIEVDNYDNLKVNAIQPGHPAAGNLMLPGTQTDAAGMGISPSQILHIFQDSNSGKLNRRDFGGGSEPFGVYPSDKPIVDVYGKILKE